MAPRIRTRPRFLHSLSLPSGSFHKPLILIYQGRQNKNHNHRKLTKLITWITALSSSMKLWPMPCRATQDRQVIVESSDKTWSTGEGNGKLLQYSRLENPMNSMKRQRVTELNTPVSRETGGFSSKTVVEVDLSGRPQQILYWAKFGPFHYLQKVYKWQMLERVWSKGNPTLLLGM